MQLHSVYAIERTPCSGIGCHIALHVADKKTRQVLKPMAEVLFHSVKIKHRNTTTTIMQVGIHLMLASLGECASHKIG